MKVSYCVVMATRYRRVFPFQFKSLSLFAVTVSLLVLSNFSWSDDSVPTTFSNRFAASYDAVTLPQREHLGLLGATYLRELNPYFSAGFGVYSAVSGMRGGFFTGGFTIDGTIPLTPQLRLVGGGFFGGGGGGAAPQGGGMMVRPHMGISYRVHAEAYGFGVSRVQFPNGSIDSMQMTLSYSRYFRDNFVLGWDLPHLRFFSDVTTQGSASRREMAIQHQWYYPPNARYRRRGSDSGPIPLLGARWRVYGQDDWFYDLQSLGAWGGDADGYAEWDVGMGKFMRLGGGGALYSNIALGSAGGGGIDTAGGLLLKAGVGWAMPFGQTLPIRGFIDAGYLSSLEVHYTAFTVATGIEYGYSVPRVAADATAWQAIRVRSSVQRYLLPESGISYAPHINSQVDLVQMKLDWLVFPQVYAGVQTSGAYAGGVGGFATGMVGVGMCIYCSLSWALNGEWYIGASGGGGMPVGGGAITQTQVSLSRRTNDWFEWSVGVGRFVALHSPLRAWMVEIGAGIRFSSPRA